jgi:hypothetical protein
MQWQAMVLLGAYHGINPGMGWLFAVALGMQQGSARGVWRALPPLAFGHAAAVGAVLLVAAVAQIVVPIDSLKAAVGLTLIALGCYRLWRHRHPRFGGMQVGFRDLTIWSFLMASAHGAGLMVVPFVMPASEVRSEVHSVRLQPDHDHLAAHPATRSDTTRWHTLAALGIHTMAYLMIAASTAWIVYRKLGLALLRTAWFNLDWLWAGALVATGAFVLVM